MGAQHTPGPWFAKADKRRWNPNYVEAERAHIADVMPCSVFDKKNDAEAEANARLIAAAPDLLETGRELADAAVDYARLIQVEHYDRNDIAVHAAYERLRKADGQHRAAIAKAEGQQ